jgi:5-methylcytosine-specific restriction endonuclease McrA
MRAARRTRRHNERANGRRGGAVRLARGYERFTLREIAERDGWRCHLCHRSVPDRKYRAKPNDPTIDHLIPLSDGGSHTRVNVALAHNRCNSERSDQGAAQLRLVG